MNQKNYGPTFSRISRICCLPESLICWSRLFNDLLTLPTKRLSSSMSVSGGNYTTNSTRMDARLMRILSYAYCRSLASRVLESCELEVRRKMFLRGWQTFSRRTLVFAAHSSVENSYNEHISSQRLSFLIPPSIKNELSKNLKLFSLTDLSCSCSS